MNAKSFTTQNRARFKGLEVRYERSFLLDLKHLESSDRQQIQQLVFEEFTSVHQLYTLPAFRPLGNSEIFYRFTVDRYFISLEITGQIVKFLRLLPKPEL